MLEMSNFKIGRGHLQLRQALGKQTLLGTGTLFNCWEVGCGPRGSAVSQG